MVWWYTPIISATRQAIGRKIMVWGQPCKNEIPYLKNY
jgi:hypothetical protein